MKFNGPAGQELRTWILFLLGCSLAVIFALKGNPLNPWWTLIIGAFTCTAVIVSAVLAITGGMSNAAKRVIEDAQRNQRDDQSDNSERGSGSKNESPRPPSGHEDPPSSFSNALGTFVPALANGFRRRHPNSIQSA